MAQIDFAKITDFTALEASWRTLEEAADGGFFRSWSFIGCQIEQRFAGAWLLRVHAHGQDVALALAAHRYGRFWLNQTGDPAMDALFIEHNGLLIRRGHAHVAAEALKCMIQRGTLVMAGIDDATLAASRTAGWPGEIQTRPAPFVDLTALRGPYLDTLSASARAQIRRAQRLAGPDLTLTRAGSVAEAHIFFAELVAVHQQSWQRRGKPGAFADPAIVAFHQTLITRAWPRNEVDVLRVAAGARLIGVLYQFIHGGRVLSYQSGLAYSDDAREKPGLVCHALAVAHYARLGFKIYDFLAGDAQYKRTLSNACETMYWVTLYLAWSAQKRQRISSFLKKRSKKLLSLWPRLPKRTGAKS